MREKSREQVQLPILQAKVFHFRQFRCFSVLGLVYLELLKVALFLYSTHFHPNISLQVFRRDQDTNLAAQNEWTNPPLSLDLAFDGDFLNTTT